MWKSAQQLLGELMITADIGQALLAPLEQVSQLAMVQTEQAQNRGMEVMDVNAVLDGADAVMLSGETSVGKYPVQAIEVMDRIITKTEEQSALQKAFDPDWIPSTHEYDPLSRSACILADQLKEVGLRDAEMHGGLLHREQRRRRRRG